MQCVDDTTKRNHKAKRRRNYYYMKFKNRSRLREQQIFTENLISDATKMNLLHIKCYISLERGHFKVK